MVKRSGEREEREGMGGEGRCLGWEGGRTFRDGERGQ